MKKNTLLIYLFISISVFCPMVSVAADINKQQPKKIITAIFNKTRPSKQAYIEAIMKHVDLHKFYNIMAPKVMRQLFTKQQNQALQSIISHKIRKTLWLLWRHEPKPIYTNISQINLGGRYHAILINGTFKNYKNIKSPVAFVFYYQHHQWKISDMFFYGTPLSQAYRNQIATLLLSNSPEQVIAILKE